MAETRQFVKVFLASPGDLDEERKAAKSVVDDFNNELAEMLGYQIELVGWEDTLPSIGRPQEIINRDLDGCELFIGMLWKRWGTPPGTAPYTSGFEEEFNRSMIRYQKEGFPEISLLLKDIDAPSCADPGDHLKKVLEFREKIVREKKLLFGTFSDKQDFERKFRRCIQDYIFRLKKRDSSAADKDQTPLPIGAQTENTEKPSLIAPLSIEGARFLREFIKSAENSTDGALIATEVARFRLLSKTFPSNGNDQESLGAHDANLLFKVRTKFHFDRTELNGLIDSGLTGLKNENIPLWYWLNRVDWIKKNILPISSVINSVDCRVGALNAMRFTSTPIVEEEDYGRKEIISTWLSKNNENEVKVAALEYLEECGQYADLQYINDEIERNDAQTSGAAAGAFIRITLRNDRRAALEALYKLQPTIVKKELLNELFRHEAEFEDDALLVGLSHRNSSIRTTVLRLLRKRKSLSVSAAESLLNDVDAEVRYEALLALIKTEKKYSVDQAEAVLVRKVTNAMTLGLYGISQSDKDGEPFLELYKRQYFDEMTNAQLEEEERSDLFEQNGYFALIRRNFKLRGDDLREAVADRFVTRFNATLDRVSRYVNDKAEFTEKTRALEVRLRREFTREGLDIICKNLDPVDLPLVRSMLATNDVDYSPADLLYLGKFGQWCDIPTVIDSVKRSTYRFGYPTLLSTSYLTKYNQVARALYELGKDRLSDLLAMSALISDQYLLACVIRLIPDRVFKQLTENTIISCMHLENNEVRKMTSLKFLRAFSRDRVQQFLEQYMTADKIYYNVIHWLDFGVSIPRDRMMRAAKKIIADDSSVL